MPFRFLLAADERVHFREEPLDDAEIQREGEANRWPRRKQELLELTPHALGRKVVERNGAAQRERVGFEREAQPGSELDGAKHAQAVVAECLRVDDAQDSPG